MKLGKFQSYFPSSPLSVMDRYIAAELIPPFLWGVGIFSIVGVAAGMFSDLAYKIFEFDLPLPIALEVLLLKFPEFISYALPVSLLLATLLVYGRLSSDSELVALRCCGISLYRLALPAVVFSLSVTAMTFLVNEILVPAANYKATSIQEPFIREITAFSQKKEIFYPEYEEVLQPHGKILMLKRLFYAEQFDGKGMRDLVILNWSEKGLNQIITSEWAIWNPVHNLWDFFRGRIYQISPKQSYGHTWHFETKELPLSKGLFDLATKSREPDEMNIAQALEYMQILQLAGDDKKLLIFQVRTQQKIAFPFICVVFSLMGAALGSRPQQAGRARSFGMSVAIIFAYYLLNFVIGGLGFVGIFSPFMAAWLPNFFGLGVGGWLLVKAEQ